MAAYTETLNTNFDYPHIDIYNKCKDGVHQAYRAYPHTGYVMYSPTNDVITVKDQKTGKEITEIYYCKMVGMPLNYNFENFDYIAVPEGNDESKVENENTEN